MVPTKKIGNANVWTEDERPRGSSEIASVMYDRLTSLDLGGVNTVRLFSDGCGWQNMNISMISMATACSNQPPSHVTKIILHFPVTGHCFLPPDRVFGVLEREIRQCQEVFQITEYTDIIASQSKVCRLGKD